MVIMLAGLRGIDEEIWKAARVDGIPTWKTYIFIIIPMMRPRLCHCALVLIASGIIKVYDLVVAQTSGGPGIATEVPAKYVIEKMFQAQNLGAGLCSIHNDADLGPRGSHSHGPTSNSEASAVGNTSQDSHRSPNSLCAARPLARAGPNPSRRLSPTNIMLYGTLFAGLDLLPAAALRDDRDLPEGNAGNPSRATSFRPTRRESPSNLGSRPGPKLAPVSTATA